MLKSSRLVAITGCLLGLSVALLPLGSHAVTIIRSTDTVSAIIDGYVSFAAVSHTPTTDVSTYDSTNNKYVGTFDVGGHTEAFGTTRYQVSCNFLADNDFTPNTCQHGWTVTATSTYYDATTDEAEMRGAIQANAYTIKSITANGLTGANSNWLMKVTGVSRTYNGNTTAPSGAAYTDTAHNNLVRNYDDHFEAIPYNNASSSAVAEGNTFTCSGNPVSCSYNGTQDFDVTYGFSAGFATADTYTGIITYTLSINAAS